MKEQVIDLFKDTWDNLKDVRDCFSYQDYLSKVLNVSIKIPPKPSFSDLEHKSLYEKNSIILAQELDENSGHTAGNLGRKLGITNDLKYSEILQDCASFLNLESKEIDDLQLEKNICDQFLTKIWDSFNETDRRRIREELVKELQRREKHNLARDVSQSLTPFKFLMEKNDSIGLFIASMTLLSILANALGISLGVGVFFRLTRGLSLTLGPIGWVLTGIWAVYKLGQPSYQKKVIPSVIIFFTMRQQSLMEQDLEEI